MNRVSQNLNKKAVWKTISYSTFLKNVTEICCCYGTNKHYNQLQGPAPLQSKLDRGPSDVVCVNDSLSLENKLLNIPNVKKTKDICSECHGMTVFFKGAIFCTVFFSLLSTLAWQLKTLLVNRKCIFYYILGSFPTRQFFTSCEL